MPPGPALVAALGGVDPARLCHNDCLTFLEARERQENQDFGLKLGALFEAGRRVPGPGGELRRLPHLSQWAGGEVSALVNWSERKAARELCLAEWVVNDLPQAHAELLAGRLDRAGAWVFADYLNDLPSELQTTICTALVGPAAGWTAGWLANRLRRMILEADPEWAARRYHKAVRERGVTAYPDQDGTMTISGRGLAPDEAAAAMARIDELAAEIRRAGHPSLLPQIRADLYVGLLDGSLPHRDRGEILTAMLARARPDDTEPTPPDTTTDTTEDQASGYQTSAAAGEDAGATAGATGGVTAAGRATDAGPGEHAGSPADQATPGGEATADPLTGADLTDTDGQIVFGGLTRKRPLLPPGKPPGRCRVGFVELHISAELLAALTGGLPAGLNRWAPVLADIAAQYTDRERLLAQLDARPGDRFPHAGLDRFLRIRDRTCVAPGCRRSAVTCQIDHIEDHADGGPTTQANTAPLCARHHFYKTAGAWQLRQTRPGVFEWTSPLGRVYRTQTEPLNPPPPTPKTTPPAAPSVEDPDPPP